MKPYFLIGSWGSELLPLGQTFGYDDKDEAVADAKRCVDDVRPDMNVLVVEVVGMAYLGEGGGAYYRARG